jgi:hypothetical protein
MLEQPINTLGWNVRGLNDQDRKGTVHETIAASTCHILCLQETKLVSISAFNASYIGGYRLWGFAERLAIGTRGGILPLWDDSVVHMSNIIAINFCLLADVHILNSSGEGDFKITMVYGLTANNWKGWLLRGAYGSKAAYWCAMVSPRWFQQIRWARDKNKKNVNRSRINRFRVALQSCELHEIHLQNCCFTWSNERETQRYASLMLFIAMMIGMCASIHMFLMHFHHRFRIIVRFCLPVIGGLGGQVRSSLKKIGCECPALWRLLINLGMILQPIQNCVMFCFKFEADG